MKVWCSSPLKVLIFSFTIRDRPTSQQPCVFTDVHYPLLNKQMSTIYVDRKTLTAKVPNYPMDISPAKARQINPRTHPHQKRDKSSLGLAPPQARYSLPRISPNHKWDKFFRGHTPYYKRHISSPGHIPNTSETKPPVGETNFCSIHI